MRATVGLACLLLSIRPALIEARVADNPPGPRVSTGSARTAGEQTPIDAERAFAADAQTLGQWTAFAKWSADDAMMFVPQPVDAHAWLKDRANPARAVEWWPTASYLSCDGTLAVNTGGWRRADGSVGYFDTVWARRNDGSWRWILDIGGPRSEPPARSEPVIVRAACRKQPNSFVKGNISGKVVMGNSSDTSIGFVANVAADGASRFRTIVWNGKAYDAVIDDRTAAPLP